MARIVIVRNDSGSTQTWEGRTLTSNEEYTLLDTELYRWSVSESVLASIATADLAVSNGTDYFGTVSDSINWMKGNVNEVSNFPASSDVKVLSQNKNTGGFDYIADQTNVDFRRRNIDSLNTTALWTPKYGYRVSLTDIMIYGKTEAGDADCLSISLEALISGKWEEIYGLCVEGHAHFNYTHNYSGRFETDRGDGANARIRAVTQGSCKDKQFTFRVNLMGYEIKGE